MPIKLNTVYNLSQLKKELGFGKKIWENRKEEFLEHLKIYYDYEMTKMCKGYNFIFHEQYGEFQPLPRKRKVKDVSEYYRDCVIEEVQEQPWNTGSNISRNIIAKDRNIYNHAITTMCNYVRPIIKNEFLDENSCAKWMCQARDKLSYRDMTEEELIYFDNLLKDYKITKEQAKIKGDFRAGYITEEEAKNKLFEITNNWFDSVIDKFHTKFGRYPVYVRYLEQRRNFEHKEY